MSASPLVAGLICVYIPQLIRVYLSLLPLSQLTTCFRREPSELAHSFYSVLEYVSVFMAHSIVFHLINSPENSPLSRTVLTVLFLPYWSFELYVSFFSPDIIPSG